MLEERFSFLKIYLAVNLICVLFGNHMDFISREDILKKKRPKKNPEIIFTSVILAKEFHKNNPLLWLEPMSVSDSTACVYILYDLSALGTWVGFERTDALFANAFSVVLLNRLHTEWPEIYS